MAVKTNRLPNQPLFGTLLCRSHFGGVPKVTMLTTKLNSL